MGRTAMLLNIDTHMNTIGSIEHLNVMAAVYSQ
jgi:hypothetical protein